MEKIDILMPTYNGEKYIRAQLDSILSQSYSNINIIISDDNSTDSTVCILEEYVKKDNRIQLYKQKENLGCVKNIEFLLKKVTSDYYMLSDQDDVWNNDKIEITYNKMIESNADLVFTDLEIVDKDLNTLFPSFTRKKRLYHKINKCKESFEMLYLYNCVTGCTLLTKKKFIDKTIPFPSNTKYIIHDAWIALNVALNGKIVYIDKSTIKYRQHDNNVVGSKTNSKYLNDFDMLRNLFIDVKLELFDTYLNSNLCFPLDVKELNKKAFSYFSSIREKKNINLKNISIFHKLYRYESLHLYVFYFVIMNLPILARIGFNIFYFIRRVKNNL